MVLSLNLSFISYRPIWNLSIQVSRYSLLIINEIGTMPRQRISLKSISSSIVPYSFQGITNVWDGSNFQSTSTGNQSNEVYCESPFAIGFGYYTYLTPYWCMTGLDDTKAKQGIAVCISMLWCQGDSRLRETSQFPLSTTIITGSTLADWCLTLIEKITMYFSQSFLGFAWHPTEPSKRIMANNSCRVSVFWSSR